MPTDEEREVLPIVKKTGIGRWVFIVVQAVRPRRLSAGRRLRKVRWWRGRKYYHRVTWGNTSEKKNKLNDFYLAPTCTP